MKSETRYQEVYLSRTTSDDGKYHIKSTRPTIWASKDALIKNMRERYQDVVKIDMLAGTDWDIRGKLVGCESISDNDLFLVRRDDGMRGFVGILPTEIKPQDDSRTIVEHDDIFPDGDTYWVDVQNVKDECGRRVLQGLEPEMFITARAFDAYMMLGYHWEPIADEDREEQQLSGGETLGKRLSDLCDALNHRLHAQFEPDNVYPFCPNVDPRGTHDSVTVPLKAIFTRSKCGRELIIIACFDEKVAL